MIVVLLVALGAFLVVRGTVHLAEAGTTDQLDPSAAVGPDLSRRDPSEMSPPRAILTATTSRSSSPGGDLSGAGQRLRGRPVRRLSP